MRKKDKQEAVTEIVEQPITEIEKKKTFPLFKKKEKDIADTLDRNKVKEKDGLFKHRVTGKEFNTFVEETQSAIIQIKQQMLSFNGRVDDIGVDLTNVDKRHNIVNEATVQALKQTVDEIQLRDEEHKKTVRIYQIITAVAVLLSIASFILYFVK